MKIIFNCQCWLRYKVMHVTCTICTWRASDCNQLSLRFGHCHIHRHISLSPNVTYGWWYHSFLQFPKNYPTKSEFRLFQRNPCAHCGDRPGITSLMFLIYILDVLKRLNWKIIQEVKQFPYFLELINLKCGPLRPTELGLMRLCGISPKNPSTMELSLKKVWTKA